MTTAALAQLVGDNALVPCVDGVERPYFSLGAAASTPALRIRADPAPLRFLRPATVSPSRRRAGEDRVDLRKDHAHALFDPRGEHLLHARL